MQTHVQAPQPVVIVTGDITIDWNIACTRLTNNGANWLGIRDRTQAFLQHGASALLADLIEAVNRSLVAQGDIPYAIRRLEIPKQGITPADPRFHHAYSLWAPAPFQERDTAHYVWRLAQWLGLERRLVEEPDPAWQQAIDETPEASLILLDDADLGFRNTPQQWPKALYRPNCSWVIVKMAEPVAQGDLWQSLRQQCADQLIVVTTIDALRHTEVQISRELSWERTAQDLAWELVYNPRINPLAECRHVIVTFGVAGALWMSRRPESTPHHQARERMQSQLFFDPKVIEGMWEQRHPGGMTGYTSCLAAALAQQIMLAPEQPNIEQAIQNGLAAGRKLHQMGYGSQQGAEDASEPVVFPTELVVKELNRNQSPFVVAPVQDPHHKFSRPRANGQGGLWTILEERYAGSLDQLAQQIVLQGVEVALPDVPLGQFGHLYTVDRQEIESFRSLRALVGEYWRQTDARRPLSIAVFGTPGSGKSFGVTEVASSLLPGRIEKLDFNLSQFDSPSQLLDAFHRVRDLALTGRMPLVFWDEFDTALENQPLGWLRHFLAPMQDGMFQEGQISHPLGRAIFVFAGGTCEQMAMFDRGLDDPIFRAAKGPDFVSRLKGFVDIAGPNPRATGDGPDRHSIIRRAILLRTSLLRNTPQIFQHHDGVQIPQIDSGVLRAFLEVGRYKHGARSLESIITMSTLAGKRRFERSALPSEQQLNLHVDGRQFLSLVQRVELIGEVLEKLAAAAYDLEQDSTAPSDSLAAYNTLSGERKEAYRQIVRTMPSRLAAVGYVMRPARSDDLPFHFPAADREQLAQLEHERWLQTMLASGWRYGHTFDSHERLHPHLLPWQPLSEGDPKQHAGESNRQASELDQLPATEKEKSRERIDGIPRILARVGYTLSKVREGENPPQ